MAGKTLVELINELEVTERRLEWIKERQKEVQAVYDRLRIVEIPTKMAEDGIKSVTGQFGEEESGFKSRCTLSSDFHCQTLDTVGLHRWLRDTGNGPLIIETVNPSTLKAFIREQRDTAIKNRVEPNLPGGDIIKIAPFSRAVLYK